MPDFSKYKVEINIKTMCAYENMTGKPFVKIETEDEIKHLFYCSLIINNPEFSTMSYDVFEILIDDETVINWLTDKYLKISDCLSQFKGIARDSEEEDGEKTDVEFYMSEAAAGLIVKMGIDPHYVMYDMDQWEMTEYYDMMRHMERDRLTEERLWTYLQVLPHVGRKLGSPEKLLPFPWDHESNKKIQKELENNTAAAVAFLTKEKNG